jgi:hypothetical protein
MTITLNGIEIELPADAKVNVSEDGKRVRVELPEAKVVEKIRFVDVPGEERIIERIRVIETEKPCLRPHTDWYTYPYNQPSITIGGPFTGTTTVPNIQPQVTWTGMTQTPSSWQSNTSISNNI